MSWAWKNFYKPRKPNKPKLRFDLEKLRDSLGLRDEDMDINTDVTTYNTAVTDAVI